MCSRCEFALVRVRDGATFCPFGERRRFRITLTTAGGYVAASALNTNAMAHEAFIHEARPSCMCVFTLRGRQSLEALVQHYHHAHPRRGSFAAGQLGPLNSFTCRLRNCTDGYSHAPRFPTLAGLAAQNMFRHTRAAAWAFQCTHASCTWVGVSMAQLNRHRVTAHRESSWIPSQSPLRDAMRLREDRGRVGLLGGASLGAGPI